MCHPIVLLSAVVLAISGCGHSAKGPAVSNQTTLTGYLTKINREDGIDAYEALILARSEIIFRGKKEAYKTDDPLSVIEEGTFWKIGFEPVNRSLQGLSQNPVVYLLIDQKDGTVHLKEKYWEGS